MKNSKKAFNSTGQSAVEVKKSQKHDANLQKNSTLYFQIGLILCLLGTYALFEMQFQEKKIVPDKINDAEYAVFDVVPVFKVEEIQVKPEPKIDRSTKLIDKYEEVEDNKDIVETKIITPSEDKSEFIPTKVGDIDIVDEPEEIFVPFAKIEKVPVYPGCERKKTNEEKRKCMSKKITKLIHKKFNTGIAEDHGLSGLQKIQTQFTVDKHGNITDIKIRGNHPALEKEAKRVINKIPSMKPGYQRDTPVGVIYNLPIKFIARN